MFTSLIYSVWSAPVHHTYCHITINNFFFKIWSLLPALHKLPLRIHTTFAHYLEQYVKQSLWTLRCTFLWSTLHSIDFERWATNSNVLIFCRLHDSTGVCPMYCSVAPSCPRWMCTKHEPYLHVHPYYRVCPDILSLVDDPLSGNGCGSPNHTQS